MCCRYGRTMKINHWLLCDRYSTVNCTLCRLRTQCTVPFTVLYNCNRLNIWIADDLSNYSTPRKCHFSCRRVAPNFAWILLSQFYLLKWASLLCTEHHGPYTVLKSGHVNKLSCSQVLPWSTALRSAALCSSICVSLFYCSHIYGSLFYYSHIYGSQFCRSLFYCFQIYGYLLCCSLSIDQLKLYQLLTGLLLVVLFVFVPVPSWGSLVTPNPNLS